MAVKRFVGKGVVWDPKLEKVVAKFDPETGICETDNLQLQNMLIKRGYKEVKDVPKPKEQKDPLYDGSKAPRPQKVEGSGSAKKEVKK